MYDIEKIKENLKVVLNKKYLYLMGNNVLMCEYKGLGTISAEYNEVKDVIIKILEECSGLTILKTDYTNCNTICFYSNEHKKEMETNGDRNAQYVFSELSTRLANKYMFETHGYYPKNDYHYSLDVKSTNVLFLERFITKGSEMLGERRIEAEIYVRELGEYEILEKDSALQSKQLKLDIENCIKSRKEGFNVVYSHDMTNNIHGIHSFTMESGIKICFDVDFKRNTIHWNEYNKAHSIALRKKIDSSAKKLKEIESLIVEF